jgi:LacI family transcriptional regulator
LDKDTGEIMLTGKKEDEPRREKPSAKSAVALRDEAPAGKALRWTIHDVAKLASVSVGTVSRVINGFDNVLPETKTRVQEAIDRLGYTPNVVARSLRQQQSRTIGLVVPDFESPFFGELIDAIESEAAKVGYGLIVGASRESAASEQTRFREFESRQVEGLLFVASSLSTKTPTQLDVPIVAVDRFMPDIDWIGSNNRGGTKSAIEYLLDLGHRVIGCICGPQELAPARSRLTAFREIMAPIFQEEGLEMLKYIHLGSFNFRGGTTGGVRLMNCDPRPTAIFCSNDEQAVGLFRAADLGLHIPRDLSVIGFDNIALAEMLSPRLTTVGQPIAELGSRAILRVLERLRGEGSAPPSREMLPATLQLRESCAPPAHRIGQRAERR